MYDITGTYNIFDIVLMISYVLQSFFSGVLYHIRGNLSLSDSTLSVCPMILCVLDII
jgi:hypothetical protein